VETSQRPSFAADELPDARKLQQLRTLGETGFVRSIEAMLNDLEISTPGTERFCRHMRQLATNYRMREFLAIIEDTRNHA
jgi:hypothetical protein